VLITELIFRQKTVVDIEAQVDIGASKGSIIENRHFQIRCGHQFNGNWSPQMFWELATGESHSNYEYLQIGWKDLTSGVAPAWFNVNIAAQQTINMNGGSNGILVSGTGGLKVNGSSVATTSDRRIKNISDASGAYELVDLIQIRSYDYVDTTRQTCKYGFIAQEVEALIPEAVETITGDVDAVGNNIVQNSENATYHEMKYVKKDLLFQLLSILIS
jgi:hypothetical protein